VGAPDLICPACRAGLADAAGGLACGGCGAAYEVADGIPVLLPREEDGHKAEQARFFDEEADPEFELTRPFGTPALYEWLLTEKYRRSVDRLGPLAGARALVVCGGSGMDAHFLARAGAHVVTSDVSLGAARRARERAARFGFEVASIVADVERLPFADGAFDLVYVHDGLHHLEQPERGLAEMARVAARAVSVTEPARALATRAAVHVRLAQEREEAGNRVARLDLEEVTQPLQASGFDIARARRYPMLYRHEPGPALRALSRPPLLRLAQLGQRAADVVLARAGNKLVVQAVRR
jgi:SAM-dependent methyltransferase